MSAKPKSTARDYRIPADSPWSKAWIISAVCGAGGIVAAFGGGMAHNKERLAFSYLFALVCFLTIALGSLFFVLIQHLTKAGWSVTVRRTAEFFMAGIPVLAILSVSLLGLMPELFPWSRPDHGLNHAHEHSTEHDRGKPHADLTLPSPLEPSSMALNKQSLKDNAVVLAALHPGPNGAMDQPNSMPHPMPHPMPGAMGPGGGEHFDHAQEHDQNPAAREPRALSRPLPGSNKGLTDAKEEEEARILTEKAPYLNKTFFRIRLFGYAAIWCLIAWGYWRMSTEQDTTKKVELTSRAQKLAPAATILFALTITFAGFDWLMSLDPMWYSTIFGVYIFACSFLAGLAVLIVMMLLLGPAIFGDAVNTEHYHDLGKLLFGFLVFWAYISFAQFFLIWYGNIPEELAFFHRRWTDGAGSWKSMGLCLVVVKFVIPFWFLMSRNIKRRTGLLAAGTMMILVMHVVEMYWIVLPNYGNGILAVNWMDVACFVGVGGLYLAMVFYLMARYPVIPIGDPRLKRALKFENA